MENADQVKKCLIFKCRAGSHAYGMAQPSSDLDLRGVFAAPRSQVIAPIPSLEHLTGEAGTDEVYYELSKFMNLVSTQSPNVLDLLWVSKEDIILDTEAWSILHRSRDQLLSKQIKYSYGGYANGEFRRMVSRARWHTSPLPVEPPKQTSFVTIGHNINLPDQVGMDDLFNGCWKAVSCGQDLFLLYPAQSGNWFNTDHSIKVVNQKPEGEPAAILKFERAKYEAAKKEHASYWTWVRNRNEQRSAIEKEMGYDGKNAAHLVRILRTASEVLRSGQMQVRRHDKKELLEIRNGEWSLDKVRDEVNRLEEELNQAARVSTLPERVAMERVSELTVEVYEAAWWQQRAATAVQVKGDDTQFVPPPRDRIVVLDVEGTGKSSGERRSVEIGLVEIIAGVRTGRVFHSYLNPMTNSSYHAAQIHGLTDEFLSTQPTLEQVGREMLNFIGESPIIAHGAASDLSMLNYDLGKAGLPLLPQEQMYCSEKIARQIFPGVTLGLDSLCVTLGIDKSVRDVKGHGALLDASLLTDCVLKMMELPGYFEIRTPMHPKSKVAAKRKTTSPVEIEMAPCGTKVIIKHREYGSTVVDIPEYPLDTHEVYLTARALIIRPIAVEGEERHPAPHNPRGPSIVTMAKEQIVRIWTDKDGEKTDVQQQEPHFEIGGLRL
ncbi:exonuclease domain-containing protein [Thalassospira xianhensis]|uniref:exonuclease domain-containing protein n=1 Tax=Thalassospira xianhensis TaxID=478503 RepID=UPI000DED812D|nr:nucleotidyltransferase domain-containing protein [Thalassospira xianhensis]